MPRGLPANARLPYTAGPHMCGPYGMPVGEAFMPPVDVPAAASCPGGMNPSPTKRLPPWGCARRRVSERNRRRRLLARRLKLSAKRTDEGRVSQGDPFTEW